MGINKQVHLIILLLLVSVSSVVPPQRIPVLAAASPVPYDGHITNWTAPSTVAAMAAEVGLSATAEAFLMESETSQMVLNSMHGSIYHALKQEKPVVTCGFGKYSPCLPYPYGRKPKTCGIFTRECKP